MEVGKQEHYDNDGTMHRRKSVVKREKERKRKSIKSETVRETEEAHIETKRNNEW